MRSDMTVRLVAALSMLCAMAAMAAVATGCGDDAVKRGCREGLILDETKGECVPARSTCTGTLDGGSELSRCASEHRACIDSDAGATCAGCVAGFVETLTEEVATCEQVNTCAELDCEASQRSCSEAGDHTDAQCGECNEGLLDLDGTCARLNCAGSGVPGSLTDQCEAQHRACSETKDGALCTGCAAGFVEETARGACGRGAACCWRSARRRR